MLPAVNKEIRQPHAHAPCGAACHGAMYVLRSIQDGPRGLQDGQFAIATNPDLGGQVGVTGEKENSKEEDDYRAHYVGSHVVRLTL